MKKNCLECGNPLHGRTDKKFCDNYCRSAYHNKKLLKQNEVIRSTISVLTKNRTILKEIFDKNEKIVRNEILVKKGFSENYFTHYQNTSPNNSYKCCFEYGFKEVDGNCVEIISLSEMLDNA
ncbi:MAG: hypothetical protein ACKOXB_09230 [Flavobacteriales bacterium]